MVKEYRLKDITCWYAELLEAVSDFDKQFLEKADAVAYNENIYRRINLLINQEKEKVYSEDGDNPVDEDFIEIGSVNVGDGLISIWVSADDGEPYITLEDEEAAACLPPTGRQK